MMIGNQIYDSNSQHWSTVPHMHGVRDALSHLSFLGNVHPGVELPVSIEKEHLPSASLPYHLELAYQQPKTAYVYELLDWFKSISHLQFKLCNATQVLQHFLNNYYVCYRFSVFHCFV